MNTHTNGSGRPPHDNDEKIVHLPTLAERDRMRKEKQAREKAEEEKARRAQHVPFFNFGAVPPFTGFMVVAFAAVHALIFLVLNDAQRLAAFYTLGFVPGYFTGAAGPMPWYAPMGIITHMFVHGGIMHLVFNLTMMVAMGMLFEKTFGTRAAVKFFFLCGVAGALLYAAFEPFSTLPMIGASGGISGLFGAALLLLNDRGRLGAAGRRGPWPIVAFWLVFMTGIGILTGTAWQAHAGGFIAGVGMVHLMMKGRLRL